MPRLAHMKNAAHNTNEGRTMNDTNTETVADRRRAAHHLIMLWHAINRKATVKGDLADAAARLYSQASAATIAEVQAQLDTAGVSAFLDLAAFVADSTTIESLALTSEGLGDCARYEFGADRKAFGKLITKRANHKATWRVIADALHTSVKAERRAQREADRAARRAAAEENAAKDAANAAEIAAEAAEVAALIASTDRPAVELSAESLKAIAENELAELTAAEETARQALIAATAAVNEKRSELRHVVLAAKRATELKTNRAEIARRKLNTERAQACAAASIAKEKAKTEAKAEARATLVDLSTLKEGQTVKRTHTVTLLSGETAQRVTAGNRWDLKKGKADGRTYTHAITVELTQAAKDAWVAKSEAELADLRAKLAEAEAKAEEPGQAEAYAAAKARDAYWHEEVKDGDSKTERWLTFRVGYKATDEEKAAHAASFEVFKAEGRVPEGFKFNAPGQYTSGTSGIDISSAVRYEIRKTAKGRAEGLAYQIGHEVKSLARINAEPVGAELGGEVVLGWSQSRSGAEKRAATERRKPHHSLRTVRVRAAVITEKAVTPRAKKGA